MIASTGSGGLYKAPLSKALLLVPSAFSLLLALFFQQQQSFFVYSWKAIKEDFHIWRLISGRTICLDLKDTFCTSLLIYNFKTLERRFGSRKFTSFLLGTWILSILFDFLLVEGAHLAFHVSFSTLPSGFLAPVFGLFVPFYFAIPRVHLAHVLGLFPITNKTLVYIVGLQLLTSSPYMSIVAISGLISGICYTWDVLNICRILFVPSWLAVLFSRMLEPLFSTEEPVNEARVGMGATVDIQRQQRIELLDQQLMFSQIGQLGRRRQQQGGAVIWNSLFQPWRHQHPENQAEPQAPPPPSEDQGPFYIPQFYERAYIWSHS
uniref:UBA domain containing 2 n=1 Tax=Leptobrachium leishanense TaxID=445787 RepID=A0A8C5P7Q3_9ANUR